MIDTAQDLLEPRRGKPRQSNLRRATSTAYYALFHCLARTCADLLVGGPGSGRSMPAWHQVYRALQHGEAKKACSQAKILAKFPSGVRDFANLFVAMQTKRHKADYDPIERFYKSAVMQDIADVNDALERFGKTAHKDRRAFAALVLFKRYPER